MPYPRFFLIAAALCFFAALIIALGASFAGSTWQDWAAGGLLAQVLAALSP